MSTPPPGSATTPAAPAVPTAEAPVQLAGWRLRLAWAVLAFIVVAESVPVLMAVPVYTAVLFEAEPPFQAIHVGASSWRDGVVVPRPGGVAEQAGMPRGRLVAVDGQPLDGGYTILEAARRVDGPVGAPVALTVETEDGETVTTSIVRTDALPPEFAGIGMGYVPYTLFHDGLRFLTSLVFLVTAGVIAARRRRGLVALIAAGGWLWFAFNTPLGLMLEPTSAGARPLVELPPLLAAMRALGHQLAGFCALLFVAVFPDGRARPRWALLPFLLFLALYGYSLAPGALPPAPGLVIFGAFLLAIGVGLAAQVVRYRRTSTTEHRQQTKWAMLGVAIGLGSLLVYVLVPFVLPALGSSASRVARLGREVLWAGTMAFPVGVTVSLLRYRLWGAEAAWSRSAMAAALVLVLTAIIAGGTALMQTALGTSGPLAIGLATVAAAVFFVPLQNRLADWADHRFLRDLTDLKERLPDLVAHLRETESVEGIAEAVTDRVLPAVHAAHVALVVPEGDGWRTVGTEGIAPASVDGWAASAALADPPEVATRRRQPWRAVVWRNASDRTFPVRVALRAERGGGEVATEGWLLLGPRPDGSGYGPDDLGAVAEIAGPVGRALRVVRVREARAAALRDRADALADGLRQIRDDLAALRAALPDAT